MDVVLFIVLIFDEVYVDMMLFGSGGEIFILEGGDINVFDGEVGLL